MLEPIYAENVIVGVIHKKQFQWYVTDRELWYLDYVKFAQAFESEGDSAVNLMNTWNLNEKESKFSAVKMLSFF